MIKKCKDCGEIKPETEFYENSGMSNGRVNSCKECTKLRVTRWRIKNINKVRQYDRNRPNKEKRYQEQIIRQRNYSERSARSAISNALRDGKLFRPNNCIKCGSPCIPEAHHTDYTKPLTVEWLCSICHGSRHRKYDYDNPGTIKE